VAASIAVTIGAQARLADIANDPRWRDARTAFTVDTDDICDPSASPIRPLSGDYLDATCSEASALEVASGIAMGIGAVSLVAAVTFFALDAADDRGRPHVAVRASNQGADISISGRF
jgi:hypothetical protein